MRNWIIGVISGLLLAVVLFFVVVYIAVRVGSSPPSVKTPTTLVLDLRGEIVEQNPSNLVSRFLQEGQKPTMRDILLNLEKAAADSRINGIVVKLQSPEIGWGKAEELRDGIARFRKSGKKAYCFMVAGSLRDYYISSACEKLYMQPVGLLDVKGMRGEAMFFRGLLEKIGARAELVHTGPFKTFSNTFTERQMTPEQREMTSWLIDGLYGNALSTIAQARGKTADQLRAIVEAGPYEAPQAKQAGLVDDLLYEDEVFNLFRNADANKRFNKMAASRYVTVPPEDVGLRARQKVGIVYAAGSIERGDDGVDPMGGDQAVGSDSFSRLLRDAGNDSSIKAVVVRIDSPGGDALASDSMWKEMKNLQQKKPVVISMSDVAASGGYYIASIGAPILADAGTLTASIGVVSGKVDIHDLYNKLGITKDVVFRGPNSLLDSDYFSYSAQQYELIQQQANDMYRAFAGKVADSRKMKFEQVDAIASGRVFTGAQAKEKNLVDEIGGLMRAVDVAKQKAGIAASERVRMVPFPQPKSLLEMLLERGQSAEVRMFAQPLLPRQLRAIAIARMLNGRPLFLMPVTYNFH